ncbi:MAG: hypothetical protein ACTHJ3_14625 [Pararhizobium sp.]
MTRTFDELVHRLAGDPRIATRSLWRILKVIDDEIYQVSRDGTAVSATVRQLREIMARSYLARLEAERTGSERTLFDDLEPGTAPDDRMI